jgi:hypothetical protein
VGPGFGTPKAGGMGRSAVELAADVDLGDSWATAEIMVSRSQGAIDRELFMRTDFGPLAVRGKRLFGRLAVVPDQTRLSREVQRRFVRPFGRILTNLGKPHAGGEHRKSQCFSPRR